MTANSDEPLHAIISELREAARSRHAGPRKPCGRARERRALPRERARERLALRLPLGVDDCAPPEPEDAALRATETPFRAALAAHAASVNLVATGDTVAGFAPPPTSALQFNINFR